MLPADRAVVTDGGRFVSHVIRRVHPASPDALLYMQEFGSVGSVLGAAIGAYPRGMAKTWVLQTETKGTGANMVPLERATRRAPAPEPVFVARPPRARGPEPAPPRAPRRFRVLDVMTRQPLVDDGTAAEAIEALRGVSSIVDVTVYVWQPQPERWRRLTFSEQRAMFDLVHRS